MTEEEINNLSNEQLERLAREAFLVEVLKLRNAAEAPSKPWWQKILESSSTAALITVVMGGIVGAYLTATFQWQSKERELVLLNAQKIIERREAEVKNIFDLLGNTAVATDNLIKFISAPENDTSRLDTTKFKSEIEAINKQSDELENKLKEAKGKWSAEKDKTAHLLSYFYRDKVEVKTSWAEVENAMNNYFGQQERCWSSPTTECKKCAEFKEALDIKINHLTLVLIKESLKTENIQQTRENQR